MSQQITMSGSDKLKKTELKRQLLAGMIEKREAVMQKLNEFMQNDLHEKADYVTLAEAIISEVDTLLGENDYESSLFLRNTVKPLKTMREDAATLLEQLSGQDEIERHTVAQLSEDSVAVYILVFQQQGHDLNKWTQMLRGLGRYVLGRPIYATAEMAEAVIRNKLSQEHEGYVKVAVEKSALEAGKQLSKRKDRFGNELITLPAGAVNSRYILEFVQGKKRYHFIKGELVDVPSATKRN